MLFKHQLFSAKQTNVEIYEDKQTIQGSIIEAMGQVTYLVLGSD